MRELARRSGSVGFYKPLGYCTPGGDKDPDIDLFTGIFNLTEADDILCPYIIEDQQEPHAEFEQDSFLAKVRQNYKLVSNNHDRLVVMGSSDIFVKPDFIGLPDARFIEMMDARVVLVDRFANISNTVYSALAVGSYLGERLKGLIINRVPPEMIETLKQKLAPLSKILGSGGLAIVPTDRVLAADPVSDYLELLEGQLLGDQDGTNLLVTGSTIGNDRLKGPLQLLKRIFNKVVLLGGTNRQLVDDDFEPEPVAVLITSGRLPPEVVVQKAVDAGIPLVSVNLDSFAILDRLEGTRIQISSGHEYKVDRLATLIGDQLDLDQLLED